MKGCSIPGCERKFYARGWCSLHYRRWRVHGDPMTVLKPHECREIKVTPPEIRFWSKVDARGVCWEWLGGRNPQGYGRFDASYAHRWAWEYLVGPIPAKMTLDHLCRNTICVNPDHLEVVTLSENVLRAARLRDTGKCSRGHDYETHGYIRPDNGQRQCRTCKIEYRREWGRRRKAAKQGTTA